MVFERIMVPGGFSSGMDDAFSQVSLQSSKTLTHIFLRVYGVGYKSYLELLTIGIKKASARMGIKTWPLTDISPSPLSGVKV